jgi:cytoskeleton protein RodZ
MERGIGAILHDARTRRKIELSEVEAATRIRLRFLRAIENEEWDVLPGGVYTRGFIRTYAAFLGLDGDRLAADYRESVEGGQRGPQDQAGVPASSAKRSRPLRDRVALPPMGWIAVAAVLAIAAVVIVAIPAGEGGDNAAPQRPAKVTPGAGGKKKASVRPAPLAPGVSVRLAAGAEVWVCVLDAGGRPLVDGQILEAGAEEGPFRSGSFTVSFGNGEVSMLIDGKEAEIPATSSPIGYAIDRSGELTQLSEAERPTCT